MTKKTIDETILGDFDGEELSPNLKDKMIRSKDNRAKIKLKRKKIWRITPQKKTSKNI